MNLKEKLAAALKAMQEIVGTAKAAGRDVTDDEMLQLEVLDTEATELKAHVEAAVKAEALMARIGGAGTAQVENMNGSPVTPADGSKGYLSLSGAKGKAFARDIAGGFQQQSTTGQKAFIATGAVTTAVPLAPQGPIELGHVPTSILDILSVTQHDVPVWRYLRNTVLTNNSAIVAPGALKPTSVVTLDEVDGKLEVFAHLSEYVSKYALADASQLQTFLTTQLLRMLQEKVEDQVLNGAGTTGQLTGILAAGIQTQAFAVDKLTTLRTAALKLENAGHTADAFIVNISDWAAIETTRATSGAFDLGGPIDRAAQKVWGTQVITSSRIAAGTALALDLDAVGLDTDTAGVSVDWDTATGFDKNQVRARIEGRFSVSVFQPFGVVKATLAEA